MSKPSALTLFCCLAALPLIGCANGIGPQSRAYPSAAPAAAAQQVYAPGPGAGGPAAILVMLPGPGDVLTADPTLWAAQGFDVVTPPPGEIYQLAADRNTAFERLIASAQAMANAPIWLVGPNPAIEAAMAAVPAAGAAQVSGVVVTSVASNAGSCSERMTYSYPGNGAAPKVTVSKSGNACPAGSPFGAGSNPAVVPQMPVAPLDGPRLIEVSAPAAGASVSTQQAAVQRLAERIKAAPSS
jgi:hypothetical protein